MAKPKSKAKPQPKLTRVAFKVSRLMEFCSERELQNQTGHALDDWPLVVGKEVMDNALDACEEAEVAPVISIIVKPGSIIIQDNGRGIDTETIKSILDYSIRVSSREAYVSPTRGAQGNALKTILAMGYVLDREREDGSNAEAVGVTIIETRGIKHRIEFRVDHVNNQPKIIHTTAPSPVKVGTKLTIKWPTVWGRDEFTQLAESYVWFNPHLTCAGLGSGRSSSSCSDQSDWEKWRPRNPTSAHWYDETRLQRYLAAHVARDRDRAPPHGAGIHRRVPRALRHRRSAQGARRGRLLAPVAGAVLRRRAGQSRGIAKLLAAMRKHSKPVAPKHLGVIGAEHLKQRFLAAGGNAETFKYERRKGMTDDGIPYVVEFAFGLHQSGLTQGAGVSRKFVTGANWSVGINNPFRAFGSTGEGLESTLAKVRANASQPVICALHLASAYIQYADRGKSSIILTDNAEQPDD